MFISASMLGTLAIVWMIASALDRTPPEPPCWCCPPKPPRSWEDHPRLVASSGPLVSMRVAYWLGWLGWLG